MKSRFQDMLPEKDYAGWLILGLVFLTVSQTLSKQPGTRAEIFRWIFFAASIIDYGVILFLNIRDSLAKKRKKGAVQKPSKPEKS
jgi:uncharacterized membrane protein